MTTIYLDRDFNFKDSAGNNFVKNSLEVAMIGLTYTDSDGVNCFIVLDDNSQAPSNDFYQYPVKKFVQLNNGKYKFDSVPYIYKMSLKRFMYHVTDTQNPLYANFGKFYRTNINQELEYLGNDIPAGTINEVDFFINALGKCIYPSPFTVTMWGAYERLLGNVISMGVL